jgi:hypothetical protein
MARNLSLQGDSHLTPGKAGHTFPSIPPFREGRTDRLPTGKRSPDVD